MNKSKFLKKSLAMLLAILMVVAMIPLSAAADDAPTDPEPTAPSVAAPDVTVNNRNTTKPQQEGDPYTITVLDATSVSMSWVSVEGYKAQIRTAREVVIGVPFNMLDLLQEGKVIEENEENNSVTYQVTFQMVSTEDNTVAAEWPLNITVVSTIPNDDTTIKAIVANQSFRDGSINFAFLGIEGAIDNANEIITITLPIGMSPADAGFGDGNGRNFGQAVTMVDDNNADISTVAGQNIAQRVAPTGASGEDKYARRVFVPTSTYTTVDYEAPATDDGSGTLVVTARDGRTRNYTVNFVQEEVFNNVGVKFGSNTYYASDVRIVNEAAATNATGVEVEYIIPVPQTTLNSGSDFSLVFNTKGNVVRVEDPNAAVNSTTATTAGEDNVPLLSGKNTQTMAAWTGNQKYFTVKTEANMAPNKTANINTDYWKNVKIVLRSQTSEDGGEPFLQEFQLNGYDSVWGPTFGADPYSELPTEFDYWVDYDFEFSTGNGQHPARISAYINADGAVSIPAQDKALVKNSYWAVEKTEANGSYLEKPNQILTPGGTPVQNCYIDNVNTEGGTFVLRVWAGEKYKDYTIHLKKPSQNTGTAVSGVKLLRKVDGEWKTLQATKSADGRVWTFEASGDFADLLAGTGTTTSSYYVPGFAVPGKTAAKVTTKPTSATAGAGGPADMITGANTAAKWTIKDWATAAGTTSDVTTETEALSGALFTAISNSVGAHTLSGSTVTDVDDNALQIVANADNTRIDLQIEIGGVEYTEDGNTIDVYTVAKATAADLSGESLTFKDDNNNTVAVIKLPNLANGKTFADVAAAVGTTAVEVSNITLDNTAGNLADSDNWSTVTKVKTVTDVAATLTNMGLTPGAAADLEFTPDAGAAAAIKTILDAEGYDFEPEKGNVTLYINKNKQNVIELYAKVNDGEYIMLGFTPTLDTTAGTNTAIQVSTEDGTDLGDLATPNISKTWADIVKPAYPNVDWDYAQFAETGTYVPAGNIQIAAPNDVYEYKAPAAGGDTGVVPGVADDCLIVVDTPDGAVVTPGGEYNTKRTPIVGVSTWGLGTGFGSTPFNTSYPQMSASTIGATYADSNNLYEELEEGITTLWDWWNVKAIANGRNLHKYLVNLQKNGEATNNIETDGMIFSVKNGRNGTKQPYVIRFKEPGVAKDPAGAEIKAEAATTAIDESLVYAANTVTNAVTVVNSNIVSNLRVAIDSTTIGLSGTISDNATDASPNQYDASNLGKTNQNAVTSTTSNNYFNPGYIDPANSAYIGAVGGHNEFLSENGEVTVSKVPNTKNEYVIAVHVPADFMSSNTIINSNNAGTASATLAPGTIFFTDLTVSDGAKVWRNSGSLIDNTGATTAGPVSALTVNVDKYYVPQVPFTASTWKEGISNFVLDDDDATQQADSVSATDATKRFVMSNRDLDAWKGGVFNPEKVSQGNILYVYKSSNAAGNTTPAGVSNAKAAADAVYYVSVIVDKDQTGELLTTVSHTNDVVDVSVNQAMKTVTLSVPASYNWVGTRDSDKYDFELNFKTSDGAILLDAAADAAFPFRDNDDSTVTQNNYRNFSLTDLVQEEQDINKWVSADADSENATKFFVKDNELFIFNPNTGAARQVTGMGDEIKDAYINPSWRLIMDQEAELRVYPESRENVNTYKLELKIKPESSLATLTHVQVDETTAEIDNDNRTAKVALPEGTDHKQVHISVGVNGLSTVVSVAGEPYDANENRTYDLTNPIEIVIAAEDGTEFKYTLTAGEVPTPTPTAGPTDEPTPTPTATPTANPDLPSDIDQVTPTLREDVIKALTNGLMQGGPDGLFYPVNPMKRYEFALVVARATLREEGETGSASDLDKILIERYGDKTCVFSDVTDNNWGGTKTDAAVAAINLVVEKGYMQGTSATTFAPAGTITREQAALTMARVAGLDMTDTDVSNFADASKISSWAKGGVAAAYKAGIMNGTGNDNFTPLRVLQRQEGAAILSRYYVDGNGKPEPTNPDEGEEGGEPTNPDEGEEGGEPTNPDEGEEGGEPTNPDEGEEGGEPTNPDEGEEGGEPTPEPDDNGDDTAE